VLSGPVFTDAAGREDLGRFFKQWTVAPDGSHLLENEQPELYAQAVLEYLRSPP
jgi:pimeloyl-ACP methyl ester carboxylesterase